MGRAPMPTAPVLTPAAPFHWSRRRTRRVAVGDVGVGGGEPIRVQSMTTPATTDVAATAAQIARLARAGCEIVRVTVPTSRDAAALPEIRGQMRKDGVSVPLAADIHFSPAAAMLAVEHVQKVRINPGNYADKKRFQVFEISDADYAAELERIEQTFKPLVLRARERGVSMRIGTNHGSLSDRILNRYGDTPLGMVESALEFVRICERHSYRDLILSMKSSNPQVMIQAYRLLAARMDAEGMDYPFHLGVTEAGDGEDGRIKSAIGIGALLEEGIGDTIRVSLTEDPVEEVPVAFALAAKFNRRIASGMTEVPIRLGSPAVEKRDGLTRTRRACVTARFGPVAIGGDSLYAVEVPLGGGLEHKERAARARVDLDAAAGARVPEEARAEIAEVAADTPASVSAIAALRAAMELVTPRMALSARVAMPLDGAPAGLLDSLGGAAHRLVIDAGNGARIPGALLQAMARSGASLLAVGRDEAGEPDAAAGAVLRALAAAAAAGVPSLAASLDPGDFAAPVGAYRLLAARLDAAGRSVPIVLRDDAAARGETPALGTASLAGSLLCDGIGDSLFAAAANPLDSRRIALGILQGARVRISKTEFISCPSCGRTQFDLEETTRRIKARTAHLKGLKIAIMGCIVNGPGEMADADFGYVGWGRDKISLFVGKDLVEKDISTEEADERLIALIKEHGRWSEPPSGPQAS